MSSSCNYFQKNVYATVPTELRFRAAVLQAFPSARAAFDAFTSKSSNKGSGGGADGLSRSEFRAVCNEVGLQATKKEKGVLRKMLDRANSKKIDWADWDNFFGASAAAGAESVAPSDGPKATEEARW